MAATITKRRDGDGLYGPRWRVLVDGKPTRLSVEKSSPPRFRSPQLWDVIEGDNPQAVLFDSTSLEGALAVIAVIVEVGR